MLGSKIKACKPLRNDLKVVRAIGITFLYDAGYSVVLLRPKNEVKPLTQSVEKGISMGKWPVPSLAIYSPRSCGPLSTGFFYPNVDTSVVLR